MSQVSLSSFIWSVADLLRGDYKQSDYGKVILPFTVLRRLDCVLEPTKEAVLAEFAAKQQTGVNPEPFLLRKAGQSFYNTSPMDMRKLIGDQDHIRENLFAYVQAFSPSVRDIFERFDFYTQVDRLANGRIGRLLIPLFLFQKRALASPMFYLSEYLETNRDLYYARLRGISQDGDWNGWIEFFLDAVVEQARTNTARVQAINSLYGHMKVQIAELTRSPHAMSVLDTLFDRPIFQSADFVERSGIPKPTALPLLRKLREAGILHVMREHRGQQPAIFAYRDLLNCAEGRNVL